MDAVLLVEDDADIRAMIGQLLEIEGYRVIAVPHGAAALEILESGERPSVILLDLMMPVMNGWQFRERQRADPRLAQIPVAVFTGDCRGPERAEELAVQAYLKKPIDLDQLLETVARYRSDAS